MKDGPSAEDDGNKSDPDDSETPWVCTLKVRSAAALSPTSIKYTTPAVVSPASS